MHFRHRIFLNLLKLARYFSIIEDYHTVSRIINEFEDRFISIRFSNTFTKPLPDRLSEKPIIGGPKFIGLIFRL